MLAMKRAIEEDFPIVEINRLAVPERNSFKPIYQMHKWFARRASCVFRAILLGALKPVGTDIMAEFYRDHAKDKDTTGKVVLDPFMGGGTTVVEALRLGCKVVGVDLNPVAWFIVKTEVEPVDLAAFEEAFDRLANHSVLWSGKPLRETLLDLYKTAAPYAAPDSEQLDESNVIYTFWVKSAICTGAKCGKQVPLFSSYIIAAKSPSIRYYPDCECPKCGKKFDWEIEPAALVSDPGLMVHSARNSNGKGSARWTYAHPDGGLYVTQGESDGTQASVRSGMLQRGEACCPHCYKAVKVSAYMQDATARKKRKTQRKKVPLTVLLCPRTEEVFQWRGELTPEGTVTSPAGHSFDPHRGHVTEKGRYVCPHCGNNDSIIASVRALPEDQLLPMSAYGLQAYAPACDPANDPDRSGEGGAELFSANGAETRATMKRNPLPTPATPDRLFHGRTTSSGNRAANITRVTPPRTRRFTRERRNGGRKTRRRCLGRRARFLRGRETDRLHQHHFPVLVANVSPSSDAFVGFVARGITAEKDGKLRHLLLCAFSNTLEANNVFTRNIPARRTPGGTAPAGIFARHDFQPKASFCEQNVWGTVPAITPSSAGCRRCVKESPSRRVPTKASLMKRENTGNTKGLIQFRLTRTLG